MTATTGQVPLTVVGGFLGAGKTTLLNRLLAADAGVRFAVLVNDFGDLAIDGDLVAAHGGDTVTFANGCLCCTIGDNLVRTLDELLRRDLPPEHIVVETSGVADPRPVSDIGELHPGLVRDATVVLADCADLLERAADPRLADTLARQAAAADLMVLNKRDLVDAERLAAVRAWAAEAAPRAAVVATANAELPVELVLAPAPRGAEGDRAGGHDHAHAHAHAHDHDHDHADHGALFASAVVDMPAPVDLARLREILAGLPDSVLRAKGHVAPAEAPESPRLVQLAGRRVRVGPPATAADDGGQGAGPRRALVVIGTADMPSAEELKARLDAAAAPAGGTTAADA